MTYPWYSKYPKGTPEQIGPYEYNSLIELFDAAGQKYPNRIAFENFGKQITFAEIDRRSTAFAAYLQNELKLKQGDRVAIQMPNLIQFPIAFMGVIKAGLIAVNTNPLYTPREMEHQFNDAGISAIVIVSNFAHNLELILPKLKNKPHIILTDMGDMVGGLKGMMVNLVVKYIKKMVPAFSLPNAISFKQVLKSGETSTYKKPQIVIEDLAVLQYTGGTTGVSKGAQLSHRNIIAHNAMITHWFRPIMTEGQQDIIITALPLYHIFALTVNGLLMYTHGVKSVLITNPRDMPGFVKELKKHRFSIITGVNTLFNGLLNNPDFKQCDFSALKGAIGGAKQ
jgi:long-chain acyl-CoA synthetase